ncbi:hypothetical protein DFH06DRAFT_768619 [Mycena polygramma]|nr:hypothetical protein DFH06DRAFT_768619 [Mycena polygramma]
MERRDPGDCWVDRVEVGAVQRHQRQHVTTTRRRLDRGGISSGYTEAHALYRSPPPTPGRRTAILRTLGGRDLLPLYALPHQVVRAHNMPVLTRDLGFNCVVLVAFCQHRCFALSLRGPAQILHRSTETLRRVRPDFTDIFCRETALTKNFFLTSRTWHHYACVQIRKRGNHILDTSQTCQLNLGGSRGPHAALVLGLGHNVTPRGTRDAAICGIVFPMKSTARTFRPPRYLSVSSANLSLYWIIFTRPTFWLFVLVQALATEEVPSRQLELFVSRFNIETCLFPD